MVKILKFKIIFVVYVLSFVATPAFATELFFDAKTTRAQIGEKFEVNLFLDTEGEEINAVEGKIIFPGELLKLQEIKDGNSIINFWVERPRVNNNEVLFSGIIPGGYSDKNGLIFSAVFQTLREEKGLIEIRDIKALLNDGKGTAANTATSNLQFVISGQAPASQPMEVQKDIDMPEKFTPQIAADPAIFEGKWFLVFATQDKGSGIDYYEVCERKKKCVNAESPYLLKNQDLDAEIIVKAIDKSGNKITAVISAQKPRAWYKNYAIFVILIITAAAYFIWKILWKKRRK